MARLAALVLIDFALKIAARLFLRGGSEAIAPFGPFRLGYVENSSGFGFDQTRLLSSYGVGISDAFVVCSLAVLLLLAIVVHLWHKLRIRLWVKALSAIVLYLAAAYLALALCESLHISLSPYQRSLFRALGPLAVAFVLFVDVKKPYFATMATLFMAGTIGNCASILLPPFVVVDYFGVYRASIGDYVYANAADAFLVLAMLGFLLSPLYLLAARFVRTRRVERAAANSVPDDGGVGGINS
jgi:lipoprotein signal peptidase